MTYTALERQLRALPESSLEEVSRYVEYLIYKQENLTKQSNHLEQYFGSIATLPDGMDFQRSARDEWN